MRPLFALASTCLACTVPNPAFDLASTGGAAGTTAASATSGPTVSTSGSVTGGSAGTGGSASTGEVASSAAAGTTEGALDTGDTGDTDDTGAAGDCWAQGPDGWPSAGALLDAFGDTEPTDPFLSPDGLRLYYIALSERRPFLSVRVSRDLPFPNGTPVASWNGNDPQYVPAYPAVVLGGAEMLMSNHDDIAYSLYQPDDPANKYSKPLPAVGPNTAYAEQHVTASADGEVMIVARLDGGPLPPFFTENAPRFHQFSRSQPEPGDPFTGDVDVTPKVGPLPLAVCPVLSPDGLRLFFASTDAQVLSMDSIDEAVGIYYTTRPTRAAAWGLASKIAVANAGNGITCPSSVTADGCELAYHQFHYKGGDYRMYLAARTP